MRENLLNLSLIVAFFIIYVMCIYMYNMLDATDNRVYINDVY